MEGQNDSQEQRTARTSFPSLNLFPTLPANIPDVIATSDKPELLSLYDFFQHSCTVIAQQLPPGQGTVVAHHLHHTDLCTASGSSHHSFSLAPDAVS